MFLQVDRDRSSYLSLIISLLRPKGDPPHSIQWTNPSLFHVIPAAGLYQSGAEKGFRMLVKHYQRHMNLPRTKVELRLPSHSRIHPWHSDVCWTSGEIKQRAFPAGRGVKLGSTSCNLYTRSKGHLHRRARTDGGVIWPRDVSVGEMSANGCTADWVQSWQLIWSEGCGRTELWHQKETLWLRGCSFITQSKT